MALRRVSDRALARLSMALLGVLLAVNGAVLLRDGSGRYRTDFVTESYVPESTTCSPAPGPDGSTGQQCSGTPFYRSGHDVRRYGANGIALMAAGVLGLLSGVFLCVYQLVRWAPERAGPSFGPPTPKGKALPTDTPAEPPVGP